MHSVWGEMEAYETMIWLQPPGTSSMGHVYLDAWHATGDEYYYEAAEQVATALIRGQHPSGGWNYFVDFAGDRSLKQWYSTIGKNAWRLEEFQHYYGNPLKYEFSDPHDLNGQAVDVVQSLNGSDYWPAPLPQTSHPYKGDGSNEPVRGDFSGTHVGDESDTSPFASVSPVEWISTAEYLRNMNVLIRWLAESP